MSNNEKARASVEVPLSARPGDTRVRATPDDGLTAQVDFTHLKNGQRALLQRQSLPCGGSENANAEQRDFYTKSPLGLAVESACSLARTVNKPRTFE